MLMIGLDPGVKTGFALWNSVSRKFECITSMAFWDCINEIERQDDNTTGLKIYIEAPQTIKPVFGKKSKYNGAVGSMISQRVGENKCMAKLFIKFFEFDKINFSAIPPKNKKMDAKSFKKFTKWDGRTDQHGRDAAWLVWGR